MGSQVSIDIHVEEGPSLIVGLHRATPRCGAACGVTWEGLRQLFAPSESGMPSTPLLPSPFLASLLRSTAMMELVESEEERSLAIPVEIRCDPSVALGRFMHGLDGDDGGWYFPSTPPASCSSAMLTHSNGGANSTGRRSSVSSFITALSSALVLSGEVYAPCTDGFGGRRLSFSVSAWDASGNGLADSECLWIAQELVDRCERGVEAATNMARYVERLRQQLCGSAIVVPQVDALGERMVHTFSNACCGSHVRVLRLQSAKLTTIGMSRFLRTLFQRPEVAPRRAVELPSKSSPLVCGSLAVVDIRGPWTDCSATALRILDELYDRIGDVDLPPEVLLQDDEQSPDDGPPHPVNLIIHDTPASPSNVPCDTGETHLSHREAPPLLQPQEDTHRRCALKVETHDERLQLTAPTPSMTSVSCLRAPEVPTQCSVLSLASGPKPPPSTVVLAAEQLQSNQTFPPKEVPPSKVGTENTEERVHEPLGRPQRVLLHPKDIAPLCDAAQIAVFESQELSARSAVSDERWSGGFRHEVEKLLKLVTSSANAVPIKSDTLVSDFCVGTCGSVSLVHLVARSLTQGIHVIHTHLRDVVEAVEPSSFEGRLGIALMECYGTDTSMVDVEAYLSNLDDSANAACPSSVALQRSIVTEVLSIFSLTLKSHRFLNHGAIPVKSLRQQWHAFWKIVSDSMLNNNAEGDDQATLLPCASAESVTHRAGKTVAMLREIVSRVAAELSRWNLLLVERWTALLRRWLVESEIARRQAVRALNRRSQRDHDRPPPSSAPTARSAMVEIPDADVGQTSTPRPSGRPQTPTNGRRASPGHRSPATPTYAHVKARVSTRRAGEPSTRPTSPCLRSVQGAHNPQASVANDTPYPEDHCRAAPVAIQEVDDALSPNASSQPPMTSPAKHPADQLLSPPRILQPRDTNTSAMRRIMTLESKIAELEQNPPSGASHMDRRRRSPMLRKVNYSVVNNPPEPSPRVGAAPVPLTMEWKVPAKHTAPATVAATFVEHVPHLDSCNNSCPQRDRSTSCSSLLSYVAPSRKPLPAQADRSLSTSASVEVAHAILFQPVVPPKQPTFPSVVSSSVLSYIISSGSQRTPSTASTQSATDAGEPERHRSTSMKYFSRSSSRGVEDDCYCV